ncbi:bifunctional [glutamate--ammonia ligase]-adenylyl-L-tyrosine phosphorylase/[glutamate--ammonia-ligase] adenylyltransferase [Orrella daihaiensis]|uniref:Bifunctional glutamine synthetase adenylyltransferase/adenylyl-removing enzyme n=1 Tax=Orrella daihaiensis TaxID=2782176 RepID=A0ABY4ALS9_9BURK|nr:bifunctional [glutamate--ammonia ligase]-adenylyl-L-tyrosine phosphorylase/[glutamate--ammonia-ligase] adenylyltransferase [Orrella daihaiensis]UOD51227.1 bifunctional [glutamate--ammonia ligase]-adenylyl-L-tyrosine phosphorylase/[glutamate--ammonia-ligase] adenylyltransferase [Orrella daihaiensis]
MREDILQTASAWSGALRRRLQASPDLQAWLAQACKLEVSTAQIHAWFEELAGCALKDAVLSVADCRRVLRKLRERVFFSVMVRDLAGQANLSEVTGAMTELADIAVEQAYRSVMQEMVSRHGAPVDASTGRPMEMIIIGMGKLGGGELNVSSDIDLIMLYSEEGETTGARPISHHEFFGNVTRRMMPIISEPDENGHVFRTDLRLRPDGDSGPLAWSLDAFEQYLFTQGREWERYAWLKGRLMPAKYFADSDVSMAQQHVESMRVPFVYRKYFDFDALSALRDLRERIRQDWQRRASARQGIDTEHNIKLGNGGIREIEFVVQLTQLIRGGKMPALQQRPLLQALQAQARAGLLPESTAKELSQAYEFLRRVEHALQYREDAQTHLLPSDPELRIALANALGMIPTDFEGTLTGHRTAVAAMFRDAFRIAGLSGDEPVAAGSHQAHPTATSDDQSADPAQTAALASAGKDVPELFELFGDDANPLKQRIDSFLDSHRIRGLPSQSRQRVDDLLPLLMRSALNTEAPATTMVRLLDLIETIAQRSAYLALLIEYPETLARVARIMAASPWAAQYVIQNPVVLDSLIDWGTLMEPIDFERVKVNLKADMDASVLADGQADVEQQMNLMRDLQRQLSFQLLAQDLAGVLSVEALADQLSALADLLLAQTIERVWPLVLRTEPGDTPAPRFAIIAYGKLGGKELGYSSDLDLVYLFDDPDPEAAERYTKLARRLTSWLSTMTSSGRLYEVDLRLRPDGDAGLLTVSIEAFRTYQSEHAWAWEHQAITRARFAAGDAAVGQAFEAIRQEVLCMARDPKKLADDVREMRQKISDGHPNKSELFDLKHDPGGMVDLEFVTQYLVLCHARTHPALIPNLGNIALLGIAGRLGLIGQEIAQGAIDAYRVLRKRQHALRLQGADKARVPLAEMQTVKTAVRRLWDAVLGSAT